jgi:hypothetical protein
MKNRKRNIVLFLVWLGFALPFILQTDIYPFLRYAMFAEPVRHKIQEESFFLKFYDKGEAVVIFETEEIGLYKSTVDYLLRNHYYRNEADKFLQKIKHSLTTVPGIYKTEFLHSLDGDTTIVATIILNEQI